MGWGGMGSGNNVHVLLQTHALSWGRALVGWGRVGCGNNVQFRLQTHALSWGRALVGWGGVGWDGVNNVQFRLQTHALSWGRALVGWGGVTFSAVMFIVSLASRAPFCPLGCPNPAKRTSPCGVSLGCFV